MRPTYSRRAVVLALFLGLSVFGYGRRDGHSQTLVSYQAEDGWTIYGTLYLPDKALAAPVPGVVLLPNPGTSVRSIYGGFAQDLTERGMVALSIDVRGSAQSEGRKPFFAFSPEEQEKVQLDIRGAIQFLASQKGVDPRRIALVGGRITTHYAAMEASSNHAVRALVFLSGLLRPPALEFIKARSDVPIFVAVDPKDRESFMEMAEAYSLSKNEHSEFVLSVWRGPSMFNLTAGLQERVADWLAGNVKGLGREAEISFTTEDGWPLHGRLWMPDEIEPGSTIPGVVLVHGANHDQTTYYHLAQAITKKGIAALTFDWRGKNIDSKKGRPIFGVDMTTEERDKVYLDVKAAIQFLASQKGVDGNRMGLVSATRGVYYAVQAASMDRRVKTIVMLTGYDVSEESDRYLQSSNVPIFMIASSEDINVGAENLADLTRENYELSGSKETEFLLFDNAGRGSEMLKTRPELEAMIVRWFVQKLVR